MNDSQYALQVAIPSPLNKLFEYLPPKGITQEISIGARVRVPFGKRVCIGFVIKKNPPSFAPEKLKTILEVVDDTPLFPKPLWQLFIKAHQYYHHSLGEVILTGLPKALREGKPPLNLTEIETKLTPSIDTVTKKDQPTLNPAQQTALDTLLKAKDHFGCFLLEGITGSGKTEIYIQTIRALLTTKTQILILVPEISLTPQTLSRFQQRFDHNLTLYHSQMTPKQKLIAWSSVREGTTNIIIGTRSALFLPFKDLKLIVIDEEHDASFKQQEGFKYSARDMAVLLAKLQNIPIILGSATPSFESLYNATSGKYTQLLLPYRAGNAEKPSFTIIDTCHKKLDGGLSNKLIYEIKAHLENDNQVLIFLNRRGYAPALMCFDCGWLAECSRCESRYTFHQGKQNLRCHHCEATRQIPQACPNCDNSNINPIGTGTEKLEETLNSHFPNVPMVRIDKDSTSRKGELEKKLDQIHNGEARILIGTQLLAKGHHFPKLTLVAIVDVDGGLFSTDFRAVERMGQLITQVAGRAGRDQEKGKVILQTFHPNHPLLQTLTQCDYRNFADLLLKERKQHLLPPFSHLALLRARATNVNNPQQFLTKLKKDLLASKHVLHDITLLGPVPAPMARRQGQHRFQLLFQSNQRGSLQQFLDNLSILLQDYPLAKKVRWSLDVDPIEMY